MEVPTARPHQNLPWLFLAGIAMAFLAYGGGLVELVGRWNRQEEYSHGFFIPLITLWLLWQRREALLASLGKPAWTGILLLLLAVGMLILGELTAIFVFIQVGFIVSLLGLVWCFGGRPLIHVTLLPIVLLLFAIPLPYFVDAQLSWRLQLVSSQIGVDFLRLIGTSVYLEGNVIDLGVYRLQVVEACSGLRYLYPLLSIGFLMAYMFRAPLWQRGILFLSTIPITVLMNSLRIAVVGILVSRWGTEMAEGFLHYFEGWIIFMACLASLLAEVWVFEKFGARRGVFDALSVPDIKGAGGVVPASTTVSRRLDMFLPLAASVVLLCVAMLVAKLVGGREEIRPEKQQLAGFPLTLDSWHAAEGRLGAQVEHSLGLDDYVLADYRGPNGELVNFYVAYYGSQRKGSSPHSPQVCIPGDGWLISSVDRVPVTLAGQAPFEVNRVLIERAGQRQVVYYWFEQRGRRIANEYWMKWYVLADSLTRNRSDGALVRVVSPISSVEPVAAAEKRLVDLMQLAVPRLSAYVPN